MKHHWPFILILVVSLAALLTNLGGYSIYILDEAKNSVCAREMMERDDWIVPTFNYQLRSDKPPLHYYFIILSYKIFGVNEFSARFFSVILGALTLIITYFTTDKYLGQRRALLTTLVLTGSFGYLIQFRLAVPDPSLIFFLTACMFSLFHGYQSGLRIWMIVGYICLGLAVLTKGPVALVLAIPGILYLNYNNNGQKVPMNPLCGLMIVVLLAMPWYVVVAMKTDGLWFTEFFIEHNFERFLSPKEGHAGSIYTITIYLIGILMPWGIILVPAMVLAVKVKNRFIRLCLINTIVTWLFFTLSATKLPNYVTPTLPFASIIISYYLPITLLRGNRIALWLGINSSILLGLIFFSINVNWEFDLILWPYFLLLFIASVGGAVLLGLEKRISGVACTSIGSLLTFGLLFNHIVPQIDEQNPVQQSLKLIDKESEFMAYYIYNPSFSFYLKKPIRVYENKKDLSHALEESSSSFVLTRENVLSDLALLSADTVIIVEDLFETTTTAVLSSKE